MTRGVPVAQAAAWRTSEPKFRKCKNLGCDVLVGFERKDDGSWKCVERDVLGQLTQHHCKGKRPETTTTTTKQPQPQPDVSLHFLAGQISALSEDIQFQRSQITELRSQIAELKSLILRFESEFLEGRVL